MAKRSMHRGHNSAVRPDEQMSKGPAAKGEASPRQKKFLKWELNRKRRTRERRLEEER